MINYIEMWCRHGATLDNPLFVESGLHNWYSGLRTISYKPWENGLLIVMFDKFRHILK